MGGCISVAGLQTMPTAIECTRFTRLAMKPPDPQQPALSDKTVVSPVSKQQARSGNGLGRCRRLFDRLLGGNGPQGSPAPVKPGPDGLLSERYDDLQEIARGGMGIIFQARDQRLERKSALKMAMPAMARNRILAERFVAEAQLTAQLEHPNIVPVHDLGQTSEGGLYYTMKLVEGEPLNHVIQRLAAGNHISLMKYGRYQRLLIFRKVCEAIAHAHSRRIIHLDIKPSNIMIGDFGEVLLMDWGLARSIAGPASCPEPGRAGRGPVGTPAYMSPEQAQGHSELFDFQTDLFLLGATLYHLMTLVRPYSGSTLEEKISRAVAGAYVPPAKAAPAEQLPLELCRIIEKAMATDKPARYRTVGELLQDLDDLMAGRTSSDNRVFQAGQVLMRVGEQGEEGYVILRGQVEVYLETEGTRVTLARLGPGEIVGETAVLGCTRRSASVVAIEETEVEVITADVMNAQMRKLAPWMEKAVNSLAQRLSRSNAQLQEKITAQEPL